MQIGQRVFTPDGNLGTVVPATHDEDGTPIPAGQVAVTVYDSQGTWAYDVSELRLANQVST
jgi:hypothetical protein